MAQKALTAVALRNLKPQAAAYYVADAKQDGLRVRVAPNGTLTWNVAFRVKGAGVRSISLGKADVEGKEGKNLEEARERAAAILKAARDGRDLLAEETAEREARREVLTVEGLIERYGKNIASPRRKDGPLRTAAEIERRLLRAFAPKLQKPADSVSRREVGELLDAVAERYPREAEKRRQSAHAMFKWALTKGLIAENPLAGTEAYGAGNPRERVLDHDEIRALWKWLDSGADDMPSDPITVLRLQLLLGARVGEIAGMESSELSVNGQNLVWTLPASRSKNKRSRSTPLVGTARALVEAAQKRRPAGALFRTLDGSRALTSTDVGQALLNRTLPISHFTTHDLRRTFVTRLDKLGIGLDTIALTIGHQRGSAATRVLVRHYTGNDEEVAFDARVEATLHAWDKLLSDILADREPQGKNVVPIASGSGKKRTRR